MDANIDINSLSSLINILLWAFWVLCTFAAAVTAVDAPVPHAFKAAVRLSAARGKTWDTKPVALGWLRDASVPHVWFWHFYLVGVVANFAALAFVVASAIAAREADGSGNTLEISSAAVVSVVLLTHLCRRLTETLLVMRFPPRARMHVLAYVYGLAYYAVLSVTFLPPRLLRAALTLLLRGGDPTHAGACGDTATSCSMDGDAGAADASARGADSCGGRGALVSRAAEVAMAVAQGAVGALKSDRLLLLGVAVVFAGQLLQGHSHLLLATLAPKPPTKTHAPHASDTPTAPAPLPTTHSSLRRRGAAEPSAEADVGAQDAAAQPGGAAAAPAHYVVPRGGAFEWVSCPHYLGEIVIYSGFWVAQWGSPMAALVLAWVVVNLVVGAAEAQRWYRATFPTYPPHRKALFPLLW